MEMTVRPMTAQEKNYCYAQSQQLDMQTGSIGHLRADFGTNGGSFYCTWFDHRADLKSDAFKAEFDDVINALRDDPQYGGVLKSRRDMTAYCRKSAMEFDGNYTKEYGIRVDTAHYSYLLRMNELVTSVSNARTGLLFASVLPDRGVTVEVKIKLE